ncbi:hypothetical protein MN116_003334 [Schistosoma mekongi]|uniref:Cyclin-like domain-containing protein n=1 Tax=Schistosoma mekongi TaxID=38744 RepID=A0AAE1ZH56_SCHME|nr:hypothetical protein MN116_003334 [Schistosoma mekongi]
MGNRLACCRQSWIELHDGTVEECKNFSLPQVSCYQNNGADFSEEDNGFKTNNHGPWISCTRISVPVVPVSTYNATQHISEREPEDAEFDPSLNASQHTLFFSGITPKSQDICTNNTPKSRKFVSAACSLKRWSSCSTVYVGDGYLARPDVNDIVWSVSVAVQLLMCSDLNRHFSKPLHKPGLPACPDFLQDIYEEVYKTFDERVYPVEQLVWDGNSNTSTVDSREYPEVDYIQQFLRGLFSTTLLGPECAIVALIFLERLIIGAELVMTSWTWRRQLLACVLLASKVLDDQAVWNIDYCQILRDIHVEDLNALERHTLKLLQFNINVPPGVYARYYFDLLTVGESAGVANQVAKRKRLTPERARNFRILPTNLEACTRDETLFDRGLLFDLPSFTKSAALSNNKKAREKDTTVQKIKEVKSHKNDNHQKKFIKTPFLCRNQSSNHHIDLRSSKCDFMPVTVNYQSSDNLSSVNELLVPIQLDEETDYVNSTPPAFSKLKVFTYQSKQSRINYSFTNQELSSQFHPLLLSPSLNYKNTAAPCSKYLFNSSCKPFITSNSYVRNFNPSCSITEAVGEGTDSRMGTEFIRSLMGGDVAYSLLRDSGLY